MQDCGSGTRRVRRAHCSRCFAEPGGESATAGVPTKPQAYEDRQNVSGSGWDGETRPEWLDPAFSQA